MTLTEEDRALIESVLKGDAADAISQDLFTLDEVIALLSAARQARTQGPGEGLDEPTRWLLRYVDASGGKVSASEYRGNPIDLWRDDRGQETDTLNVAIEDGLLSCSHNSDTDESWVWITDAGRRALPAPPASQAASQREAGWLVEHYASKRGEYLAEWLTGWPAFDDSAPETWTKDSAKAIRFARREDAEQVIQTLGWTEARATEHVWAAPPASQIKEG